jgi:hypothetical protein
MSQGVSMKRRKIDIWRPRCRQSWEGSETGVPLWKYAANSKTLRCLVFAGVVCKKFEGNLFSDEIYAKMKFLLNRVLSMVAVVHGIFEH